MNIPEGLKYTKDHEWVKVEGASATCGITEFAQGELGEVVFADLPAIGKSVKRGETLCVVESTKAASDVYAPIGGTVAAVNDQLGGTPNLINSDPYGAGWMVKFDGLAPADLAELMDAAQYRALIGK